MTHGGHADPPPTSGSTEAESGDLGLVVLRVWWEDHDGEPRGRVVAPRLAEPSSARGDAQLLVLVGRALKVLAERHRDGGGAPVTHG